MAHDPRIIPFANRIIHIEDGRIVGEEPGAAGRHSKISDLLRIDESEDRIGLQR